LETFADPATAADYKELASLVLPRLPPDDLAPLPSVSSKPSEDDPSRTYGRFLDARDKARREILHLLKTGELLAVGYIASDRRRETPQWIAARGWETGRVSWDESQLWTDSNEIFEEVRIIQSRDANTAAIAATMELPPASRRRGRPSRRDRIIEAYRALRDAGKIDFRALHLNYASVRELVMRMNADQASDKGLSDEAIRSAISAGFKRDQQSESSTE
jgi:hypothetical protein